MTLKDVAFRKSLWVFSPAEVVVMAIPILAVASLHLTRKPLYAALAVAGRVGECSLPQAMASESNIENENLVTKSLFATSRPDPVEKSSGLVKWHTPHGLFWAPEGTSVPFLLSEQLGKFYGDGQRRVRAGDVVLDCGANIGTFTWEALSAGASLVVAIEPSERNVESLRRNFAREIEQGKVIVYPKGVWHQDEVLGFFVYDNSALDSIVMETRTEEQKQARKITIPVTTVDRIVSELKLKRVDFIKMDIEGAERNALRGSRNTLAQFRPRMSIATENLADDPQVVPTVVKELRPDYQKECGRCTPRSLTRIEPDVFYFY